MRDRPAGAPVLRRVGAVAAPPRCRSGTGCVPLTPPTRHEGGARERRATEVRAPVTCSAFGAAPVPRLRGRLNAENGTSGTRSVGCASASIGRVSQDGRRPGRVGQNATAGPCRHAERMWWRSRVPDNQRRVAPRPDVVSSALIRAIGRVAQINKPKWPRLSQIVPLRAPACELPIRGSDGDRPQRAGDLRRRLSEFPAVLGRADPAIYVFPSHR